MEDDLVVTIGNWAVYFGTVGILLFTIGYGVFAPWYRSPLGRNMLALAAVHLAVFSLLTVQLLFGTVWAGRPVVRMLVFLAVAVVYWHRGFVLLTDQIFWPRGRGAPPVETGATHRACSKCGR
jgi:hypothetical protein